MPSAVIIGSGPAGAVAAHELVRNGWDVTVMERGRNLRPGLGEVDSKDLGTLYSHDEIKSARHFGFPHPVLEPVTGQTQEDLDAGRERSVQGRHVSLGAAVGGTSMHYNAKFPRFWRQDFSQFTDLGPVDDANVADWPITYDELEPFYDEVEHHMGVQGDINQLPERTRTQTPRSRNYPMGPNPTGYAARLLAAGAERIGFEHFPYPAVVNSTEFDGRPACNSCGLCSSFGCSINARGDALVSYLNPALRMDSGSMRIIERALVYQIETTPDGKRAKDVRYYDVDGNDKRISADFVLVAGSPIQTAKLLLLSANSQHPNGLGNRSGQLGQNVMFHYFSQGGAFFDRDVQGLRAQSTTGECDDLVGPFTGPEIKAAGLPYVKGGMVQLGSGLPLLSEAYFYAGLGVPYGQMHKTTMRASMARQRIAGYQYIGEDLPQRSNRVDLDPTVKDWRGLPAPRVKWTMHLHERVATAHVLPYLQAMCASVPGAVAALAVPPPSFSSGLPDYTAHHAGTARFGNNPDTSVCDRDGHLHDCENVLVMDGSVFPTFPGFNPTLTVLANSLRQARKLAAGVTPGRPGNPGGGRPDLPPQASPRARG